MNYLFALMCFLAFPAIAIAETAPGCEGLICHVIAVFPEITVWLIAIFAFLSVVLRATSELLSFIGERLQKDKVSGISLQIGTYAIWAAKVLGWLGAGTPKALKEEKKDGES